MAKPDRAPHKVLHVYEGDGGVIVWENGNVSTFGVQSPEVMAAFYAASALLPEDAAGLVAELTSEDFRHEMQHLRSSSEIDRLFQQAASLIQSQAAGWAADKARIAALEAAIDRVLSPAPGVRKPEPWVYGVLKPTLNGERKG